MDRAFAVAFFPATLTNERLLLLHFPQGKVTQIETALGRAFFKTVQHHQCSAKGTHEAWIGRHHDLPVA